MKDLVIKLNDRDAIDIKEMTRLLEDTDDESLKLVRRVYPYKIPPNYISWRYLSAIIAMGIVGMKNARQLAASDFANYLHSHKCVLWFTQSAPIYCIRDELLESILNTDIINSDGVLADLESTIPSFILLFPKGKIPTPDGAFLDACIVHLSDKKHPEFSHGEKCGITAHLLDHEHEINLHWSGLDDAGTVWYSGAGLYPDGSIYVEDNSIGRNEINQKDKAFLAQMRSIVLQIFLLLQYEPEALNSVTASDIPAPVQRGFKPINKSEDRIKYIYPRWIEEPQRKASSRAKSANSTHASPVTHWRRGHWRRVAVGVGRIDRKWVRIAPTLVNP